MRLLAFAAALSALAFTCAGCGGGSGGAEADGPVSGTVKVLGPWEGRDQQSFEAVAHEFMLANPGVKVKYESAGATLPARLRAAVERGTPPDVAVVEQPGLLRELAGKDALARLDYMKDYVQANLGDSAVSLGSVDGKLYGFLFKVSNDSSVWFNPLLFRDAAIDPPKTWKQLAATVATLKQYGTPAYSLGVADGDALTGLFDNIYLRQAGPEKYDQLASHEIPWTDESVKASLGTLKQLFADRANVDGNPLDTDYSESVSHVFDENPEAGMVFGGDAVPTVVDPPNPVPVAFGRTAGLDYDVFPFPSIAGSAPMVVGGGDTMVSFDDSPATKAFLEYLTTSDAAAIWLKRGWFATLNTDATLDTFDFPDLITRRTAGAIGQAEAFRFDLASLQPPAFGGGEGMAKTLRGLLEKRSVDDVADSLEAAAKRAYG